MATTPDITKSLGLSQLRGYSDMSTTRICGFIIYGREHANVRKVLKDKEYWDALDAISGSNWPVFAPLPLDSKILQRDPACLHDGQDNGASFMLGTYVDTDKTERILELFGLQDSDQAPCFVLFAWNEKGELVSEAYKIPDTSENDVYNSLKEVIGAISKSESHIQTEYKKTDGAYRQALLEVEHLKFMRKVRKIAGPLKILFDMFAGGASIKSAW